jgi:hypothetical protein
MTATPLNRARTYLANLPPAISGQGGHNATFRAACWLVRFGLSDADALVLFREFNQRCQPPWTEKDLAHKLRDARRVVARSVPRQPRAIPPVRVVWQLTTTPDPNTKPHETTNTRSPAA